MDPRRAIFGRKPGTAMVAGERTRRSTVGRRERRKDARPGEIVEAAIDLFGERGFGATRLEDVARRAGVSKGTVFVYFASKDDLFRAVAKAVLDLHLERLRSVATDPDQP